MGSEESKISGRKNCQVTKDEEAVSVLGFLEAEKIFWGYAFHHIL